MAVKAKDIPKEQRLFTRIWDMFKKHYYEPNTDENWEAFIAEANDICHEYDNGLLARKMALAVLETKEQLEKEENKKKEGGIV